MLSQVHNSYLSMSHSEGTPDESALQRVWQN